MSVFCLIDRRFSNARGLSVGADCALVGGSRSRGCEAVIVADKVVGAVPFYQTLLLMVLLFVCSSAQATVDPGVTSMPGSLEPRRTLVIRHDNQGHRIVRVVESATPMRSDESASVTGARARSHTASTNQLALQYASVEETHGERLRLALREHRLQTLPHPPQAPSNFAAGAGVGARSAPSGNQAQRALASTGTREPVPATGQALVSWYSGTGDVIHLQVFNDPRLHHIPMLVAGSQRWRAERAVRSDGVYLLKGPTDAVKVRILLPSIGAETASQVLAEEIWHFDL